MLRAVAVLLERRPELRSSLTVAVVGGPSGSGLERPDSLVRLADELGIAEQVRFVPPVAQDELVDWYAASTLVCVPSYNESFGLVAIEAQATGTPVVAAAVGGLTTAVKDGTSGLLVADHEPASYAGAFERVLLEPGLREQLAAGAQAQAQQFGWDRTADEMLSVYAEAQHRMRTDLTGVAL
jgi:D-inositol-3-phosphate glycosyltransferase